MYQKGVAKMAGYASAGFVTYGTHSKHRAARVWLAVVRDESLGLAWRHASVFAPTGAWQPCSRWVRSYMARDDGQDRL